MPAKYFLCPDGQKVAISECLGNCRRKEGRCLSLPTLTDMGRDREWKGKPSITQLTGPTRLAYLKITCDYSINPQDRAFALLGTRHHKRLEVVAKKLEMQAEKQIGDEFISGILDLLEPDELQDGFYKLIDYKTWGSYALAKILSVKENGEYDRHQVELQLNGYRLRAEELGFPVSRLFCQCTVRDGGTYTARNNHIEAKLYLVPVLLLDNNYTKDYFETKRKALLTPLKKKELPPLCEWDERWGNRRCLSFCEVAEFCPEGKQMK